MDVIERFNTLSDGFFLHFKTENGVSRNVEIACKKSKGLLRNIFIGSITFTSILKFCSLGAVIKVDFTIIIFWN